MQLGMARLVVISTLALALASCGQNQPQQRAAPPPPAVTVSKPVTRMVVDQDEYVGRFIAVDAVEIRARVWGYLEAVHFTDGQVVMFIRWLEQRARRGWFIGDLHRHWFPYYGFGLLA